jgi:hypothetical protein
VWPKIETWAKQHPMALGVIIFVVGAISIYFFLRPSSSATTSGAAGPSDAYYQAQAAIAASGNQLQAAQLAAQAQGNQTSAQLQAVQDSIGGQVALAQIGAGQATTIAGLQADVAKQGISAQQETTDTASTLTAQVQNAGIAAQVAINANNNAAVNANTQTAANEQTTLASINAQVQTDAVQAQTAVQQQSIQSQLELASREAEYNRQIAAGLLAQGRL